MFDGRWMRSAGELAIRPAAIEPGRLVGDVLGGLLGLARGRLDVGCDLGRCLGGAGRRRRRACRTRRHRGHWPCRASRRSGPDLVWMSRVRTSIWSPSSPSLLLELELLADLRPGTGHVPGCRAGRDDHTGDHTTQETHRSTHSPAVCTTSHAVYALGQGESRRGVLQPGLQIGRERRADEQAVGRQLVDLPQDDLGPGDQGLGAAAGAGTPGGRGPANSRRPAGPRHRRRRPPARPGWPTRRRSSGTRRRPRRAAPPRRPGRPRRAPPSGPTTSHSSGPSHSQWPWPSGALR